MIEWIKPKTAGRRADSVMQDYALSVSTNKSGSKGIVGVLTVAEKTMRALGWVAGDKLQVAQDGDLVYVRRVLIDGFSLSPAINKKKGQKSALGKPVKCSLKSADFKFGAFKTIDTYAVADNVVTFSIATA